MKKFKSIVLFITIIFITVISFRIHAQDNNTSIFWNVTGNGLEKPSYLYGTVHLIPQSDFFFIDSLEDKFKSRPDLRTGTPKRDVKEPKQFCLFFIFNQ